MMDPRKIGQFLLGEWEKTRQPLNERMSVLPFGQYEDGSVGLAWPGMVAAPFEGVANFGRYGYDTPEAIRDNAASAFDVAGGAVTGGLGVGLAGGLADDAVRASVDLPASAAFRFADEVFDAGRGRYHANAIRDAVSAKGKDAVNKTWNADTGFGDMEGFLSLGGKFQTRQQAADVIRQSGKVGHEFVGDELHASTLNDFRSRGLWSNAPTGSSVPLAVNALERSAADLPMDLASRMARAKEMGFDTERTLLHGTRSEFDAFEPSKTGSLGSGVYLTNDPIYARGFAEGEGGRVLPVMTRGDLMPYHEWRKAMTPEGGETVGQTMERARRLAEEAGYAGVQYGDNSQVAMFDPRNIRSVNAAFDPAKSDSANLLAANAKTGAAVPLAIEAAERSTPQGIRAYHGSPHDFDRFSLDKIGTGEGAQAYGHGLYFADSEDVARSYRDALSGADGMVKRGGLPISSEAGKLALLSSNGDIDKAIASVEGIVKSGGKHAEMYQGVLDELVANRDSIASAVKDPGRMYEVNIKANPEDFLDWDKPLNAQSENVRRILEELRPDPGQVDEWGVADNWRAAQFPKEPTGGDFVKYLPELTGDSVEGILRHHGIPGIRYLDGMSRDGGTGTSNYVVFDDALIDILRKYANAPTGAAIPLGMEGQEQDPALVEYLKAIGLY